MEKRNFLIKRALDEAGVSQEKLSVELKVSRAAVSERLNKDADVDSIVFVTTVCKLTGKRFTDFVDLPESVILGVSEPEEVYGGWKSVVLKGLEMLEKEMKKQ